MLNRPSARSIVAVNLLPVAGVLFFQWSVLEILVLYWLENLVIGVTNVLKMATCKTEGGVEGMLRQMMRQRNAQAGGQDVPITIAAGAIPASFANAMKFFIIPFFIVHYGMFCFGHGTFLFALFGSNGPTEIDATAGVGGVVSLLDTWVLVAALSLLISHLYSFQTNYIAGGEYRRTNLAKLMFAPYKRIVVMHIVVLVGAFGTTLLGSSMFPLVLLVVLKTLLDLLAHDREHASPRTAGRPATSTVATSGVTTR